MAVNFFSPESLKAYREIARDVDIHIGLVRAKKEAMRPYHSEDKIIVHDGGWIYQFHYETGEDAMRLLEELRRGGKQALMYGAEAVWNEKGEVKKDRTNSGVQPIAPVEARTNYHGQPPVKSKPDEKTTMWTWGDLESALEEAGFDAVDIERLRKRLPKRGSRVLLDNGKFENLHDLVSFDFETVRPQGQPLEMNLKALKKLMESGDIQVLKSRGNAKSRLSFDGSLAGLRPVSK